MNRFENRKKYMKVYQNQSQS